MGWILFGFLVAIAIETTIRIAKEYEPEEKRGKRRN